MSICVIERFLVIGGGEVARRKVDLLLRAGARVHLIALQIIPKLRVMLEDHVIVESAYSGLPAELSIALVIAATSDAKLNERISVAAQADNIPVNVVDAPSLSSVIFPCIIDRDPVIVSVGSSAASPVLTRSVRQLIETHLPQGLSRLAAYLGSRRDRMKDLMPDLEQRRRKTEISILAWCSSC